jgi:hypothetical protein
MSHILRAKTEIKNPNMEIVNYVASVLPNRSNVFAGIRAEVKGNITDYYGNKIPVDLAIFTKNFTRGLGIKREGESLEFICDDYGCQKEVADLKAEFNKMYNATALQAAMQQMGYQVQVQESQNGIYLEGLIR